MSQILPGIYATVNASALAGTPSVGNRPTIIFGTATKGVLNTPVLITSLNDLYYSFGEKENLESDGTAKITLVRAAELALNSQGGTGLIYCIRLAEDSDVSTHDYPSSDTDLKIGTLKTLQSGQWWNDYLTFDIDRWQSFGDDFGYSSLDLLKGSWAGHKNHDVLLIDSGVNINTYLGLNPPSAGDKVIAEDNITSPFDVATGDDSIYSYDGTTWTVLIDTANLVVDMAVYDREQSKYYYWTTDWTTEHVGNVNLALETTTVAIGSKSMKTVVHATIDERIMYEFTSDIIVELNTTYSPVISLFSHISDLTGAPTFRVWLEDETGENKSSVLTITPDAALEWQKRELDLGVTNLTDGNFFSFRRIVIDVPLNINTQDLFLDYLTLHRKDFAIAKLKFDNEVVETFGTVDSPMDGTMAGLNTELANSSYIELTAGFTAGGKLIPNIPHSISVLRHASYIPEFDNGTNIQGTPAADDWSTVSKEYESFNSSLSLNISSDGYYVIFAGKTAQEGSGYFLGLMNNFLDNSLSENIERIGIIGTELKGASSPSAFHTTIVNGAQAAHRTDGRIIYVAQGGTYLTDTLSGAWYASAITGILANNSPAYALTRKRTYGLTDIEYSFNSGLRSLQVQNGALALRKQKGIVDFEAGYTASVETCAFRHITTVQISDTILGMLREALNPFIGLPNTLINQSSSKSSGEGVMTRARSLNYIKDGSTISVYASRQDEIDGIMRAEVAYQPILSIVKILLKINLT